jgi:hypothetical protein
MALLSPNEPAWSSSYEVIQAVHGELVISLVFLNSPCTRTHLGLDKDAPDHRPVSPPSAGPIIAIPEVGGLHHRYERKAA